MTEKIDCQFKILVIGETDVGKTSLTRRFKYGRFQTSGSTIVADLHRKEIVVKGTRVKLLIYDIAGQKEYKENILGYFKNVDGVLLVYDVTNIMTFNKLSSWLQQVREFNNEFAAVIVGNKIDHPNGISVSSETVERYAKDEDLEFMETSAIRGENVEAIFEYLTEKILQNKQRLASPDSCCSVPTSISPNTSSHDTDTAENPCSMSQQPRTAESVSRQNSTLALPADSEAIATSTENTELLVRARKISSTADANGHSSFPTEKKMAHGYTLNILIGDQGVGKTCMLTRYVENEYQDFNNTTTDVDYHFKTTQQKGTDTVLNVWVPCRLESFRRILLLYFRPAHGVIMLYNMCSEESFAHIDNWIKELRHCNETATIILVGSKNDDQDKQIKTFAAAHGLNFVECKDLSGENIDKIFEYLKILQNKQQLEPPDSCCSVPSSVSPNGSSHDTDTGKDSYSMSQQPRTTESAPRQNSPLASSAESQAIATSTPNTEVLARTRKTLSSADRNEPSFVFVKKKMPHGCTLNVIMLGDPGVGKTCMLTRYIKNEYDEFCSQTVGIDYHFKTEQLNGMDINLHIWDTSGQEAFRCIVPQYFRPAHGAILVYDVCRYETFVHMTNWIEELRHYNETAVIILVGSKNDDQSKKVVSRKQVKTFAETHGLNFVECSALSGENVNKVFEMLIQEMLKNADIDDLQEDDLRIRVTAAIEPRKEEKSWWQCF